MIEVREDQADGEIDYERSMINEDDGDDNYKSEQTEEYIIDDSSLLRYNILLKSYYVAHKMRQYPMSLEEYQLSEFPPPKIFTDTMNYSCIDYESELYDILEQERHGLLDIGWVSQVRAAHKESRQPMKVISLSTLHLARDKSNLHTQGYDLYHRIPR